MSLAAALTGAAQYDEALAAAEEGATIFRHLANDDLIAHGPMLIRILIDLKAHYTATGRPADAHAIDREATRIRGLIKTSSRDS